MHRFEKRPPPAALVRWRRDKTIGEGRALVDVAWDELDAEARVAIQEALAEAQGYLCAYCGGRIRPGEMRVEHWDPQHTAPAKRFDWDNLLGVCAGTDGLEVYCDVHRGRLREQALVLKPDVHPVDLIFTFGPCGARQGICADTPTKPEARVDIARLNLNCARLRSNREAAYAAVKRRIQQAFGARTVTTEFISRLRAPDAQGCLEPYLPALRPLLERLERKARART